MRHPEKVLSPAGRSMVTLFLLLIPLVTLIPVTPVPFWLTQDLVLRWTALGLFFFAASVFLSWAGERGLPEMDFPNLAVLLLAGWVLLSVKNSREASESFYAFRSFMVLVLLWFSLRVLWRGWPSLFARFERTYYWTSVAAALWLCLSTLGHDGGLPFFRDMVPRKGTFLNENVAAGFIGMALLWTLSRRLHGEKAPFWSGALFFTAWALTQSRGAFVSMLVVAAFYLLFHMKEVEEHLRRWRFFQWAWFALVLCVLLGATSFTLHKLLDPLRVDARASNRWDLWNAALRMVLDQPLLGFGPGTFQDAFRGYQPASLWNVTVAAAHNEFLQTAIECGWPALALVLLVLFLVLKGAGSRLAKVPFLRKAAEEGRIAETTFFLVLFESIHNCFDFTFHDWAHRLVLLCFATYSLGGRKEKDDVAVLLRLSPRALGVGAGLVLVFLFWTLGLGSLRDYLSRIYNFQGTAQFNQSRLEEAESMARQSLRLRRDYMGPWNLLGVIEDVRGERTRDPEERKEHFQKAEQYYGTAAELSPYSAEPLENKVRFLVFQRRLSEALELQGQLVKRAPSNPVQYIQQSQILLAMGRSKEAIAAAQRALDLDDYFIPGYTAKAKAMEALGKRRDAVLIDRHIQEIIRKQNIPDLDKRMAEVEADIRRLEGAP